MSVRDVLSDVWREACRHIEIRESVDAIAAILAPHLPLGALIVRRIEATARSIETVATADVAGSAAPGPAMRTIDAAGWRRIEKWLHEGGVIRGLSADDDPRLHAIVPDGADAGVMAGPLQSSMGPIGVLIVTCRGPGARGFTADHVRLAQRLLEPFAVALENDRRLHELESLRDAAEADRESLLKRLGRQTLTEEVVGAQTGLKHVMERVELVAKSDVPVLILGDTGTGKEVVSRAIHARSKQSEGPFIRVNCGGGVGDVDRRRGRDGRIDRVDGRAADGEVD